jgi:DNA ligase-associated metallophosphoesterase
VPLEAAWNNTASGLLVIARLGDFLRRSKGRIRHRALANVSPLAVPILLEIGSEPVRGSTDESLLGEAAAGADRRGDGGEGPMLELRPERLGLADSASQPVFIGGKAFVADQSGALFWPSERAMIVADLHLEKGSSSAANGRLLPPYDTRQILTRLARGIELYDPAMVIALGDSLHDSEAAARISASDLEILSILQEDRRWLWVRGNHDSSIPETFGGEVVDEVRRKGITLRHEPRLGSVTHEIAGHMHPAARLSIHGTSIRRPCFVANRRRLVMPAFGAFTGGLNVLDEAFAPLFGNGGLSVWMIGAEGLYPIATRQLRGE